MQHGSTSTAARVLALLMAAAACGGDDSGPGGSQGQPDGGGGGNTKTDGGTGGGIGNPPPNNGDDDSGAPNGGVDAAIPPPPPGAVPGGAGHIPTGLPLKISIGIPEQLGGTWAATSGVKWDMRYAYFGMNGSDPTKSWLHRWGYQGNPATDPDGQAALDYMKESDKSGIIPVIQYYMIRNYADAAKGLTTGTEAQTLQKVQDATIMKDYWHQFFVMMQMGAKFGKPVVIILEGDGFGFLEMQSKDNPGAPAAVASTGIAELAGLPDTVAGFGMAFLQLRAKANATNVLLGPDVPEWATGDITYFSVTDDLQPHVDKQFAFLSALGLGANATNSTFDFTAADPLDADSDYYYYQHLTSNEQDRWWNADDNASVNSKSFNRYAQWLGLFNQKSGKRWVLWQIPIGNSASKNVFNDGKTAGYGYKDNRAEYLLGTSRDAHLTKFAASGVVALLFGAGEAGCATQVNDTYSDGQLFLKSRTDALQKAGGFPIMP